MDREETADWTGKGTALDNEDLLGSEDQTEINMNK